MLKTVEGVYRNGKIELMEKLANISEDMPVIVTFLESRNLNLRERSVDRAHAVELRARLATFIEDWESPEMEIYDNYDASKSNLQTR